MPVKRSIVQALAFSGACAGIAGAVLVFGSESHRLIAEGGASGFTQSAGFNGIVAALFGSLHPLATIPASFFFGGMLTGGIALQQELQVPAALIVALNGIVVLFVVSSLKLRSRLTAWAESPGTGFTQVETDREPTVPRAEDSLLASTARPPGSSAPSAPNEGDD
jgi:simple sugar transport system permease protein